MIERYKVPEIADIWSDYFKFKTFMDVEIALIESLEGDKIPEGIADAIKGKFKIDVDRISEIEKTTRHDVIAFCTAVTEDLPKNVSKYFHFGVTSSDIIDTATTIQIRTSVKLIITQTKKLMAALEKQAEDTKSIICMGRSHGMNAEPMSFGLKFLAFYAEIARRLDDLEYYLITQMTGQLSGAVGNYTVLTPEVEQRALEKLHLKTEPVSTQTIPRDRILKLISITSMLASALERIAVEIRHLHHSDVGEVSEGFAEGQKGSSTMPHKKNPISTENISGVARVIRSHLIVAHENNALWHERDISHSSAERMILPDNLGLTFYALRRMTSTIENLVVHKERIQKKVFDQYHYLSSFVLHKLIEDNPYSRDEIYEVVQKASFESNSVEEFKKLLEESPVAEKSDLSILSTLSDSNLKSIYLKQVDKIFSRTKEEYGIKTAE